MWKIQRPLTEARSSCLRNNQKQNKTATRIKTGVAGTGWIWGKELRNGSREVGRTEWGSGFYSTEKVWRQETLKTPKIPSTAAHAPHNPSPRLWAWTLTVMGSHYHESLHRGFIKETGLRCPYLRFEVSKVSPLAWKMGAAMSSTDGRGWILPTTSRCLEGGPKSQEEAQSWPRSSSQPESLLISRPQVRCSWTSDLQLLLSLFSFLIRVWLFATLWTVALQAFCPSLSPGFCSNSCVEVMMISNHFLFCHPLWLLPSVFPSIRSFPVSRLLTSGGRNIGALVMS